MSGPGRFGPHVQEIGSLGLEMQRLLYNSGNI